MVKKADNRSTKFWALFAFLMFLFPGLVYAEGNILELGNSGGDVEFTQRVLVNSGIYADGKDSGYYGLNTLSAVAAMQKKYGLKVTGMVDSACWERLRGIALESNMVSKSKKQLVGYYTQDWSKFSSYESLKTFGNQLDYIATFSYMIDNNGELIGQTPWDALDLAKNKNVKPLLLVHNMLNEIDSAGASAVLSNSSLRKKLVGNIMTVVKRDGFAGINVDLEGVYASGRNNYNKFLEELSGALRPEYKLLTVSIPAKTQDDPGNNWSGAYDYNFIGKTADLVMLMTYDEHWYGGSPGPVASLPWVVRVADYATTHIPREKIILGIAAYGYDWSPKGSRAVTWTDMGKLITAHGPAKWHDDYCVPYFTYSAGGVRHEVWFENTFSLRMKLDLVNNYNLAGIALWRLGFEDSDFWDMVAAKFN